MSSIPVRLTNDHKPDPTYFMDDYDYLTAIARGNFLTNAGVETWDQGTSFSNPADATLICSGWTLNKGGTLAPTADVSRESTNIDSGSYSGKIDITVAGSDNSYLNMGQSLINYAKFSGETVVGGVKIKVGTSSKVRVSITDGVNTAYSDYHTGGGTFEKLYCSLAVAAAPTELTLTLEVDPANFTDILYWDSCYLFTAPSQISTTAKAALGFVQTDDLISADAAAAVETGWTNAGETWTYASATTFTTPGDKTSKYQVGDKIKLTQTTAKYFYITAISYGAPNTTISVSATVGGTAYSIANAAITAPYFSKMETPQGFPLLRTMTKEDTVQTEVDGWVPVKDSWAYASATTITVPSGAASIYKIGDKIKLTQTTAKYFYVTTVADTLLTVSGGAAYTVANAAITLPYFSKVENPMGWADSNFKSIVFLTDGNGHGSTNTKIRRFTTVVTNVGTAITYAESAAAGASFTINETGWYSVFYMDTTTGGGGCAGICVNGSALTTSMLVPVTIAQGSRGFVQGATAGIPATYSRTLYLSAGDVVRPHDHGNSDVTGNTSQFAIEKIGTKPLV